MTLEQALDGVLKAHAPLTAVVGNRIYWMMADQLITTPYLCYTIVSDSDAQYSLGNSNTGSALVQFDIVGTTKATKAALYIVRSLIRGAKVIGSLALYSAFPSQIRERFDEGTNRYVFSIDIEITFGY